jgi:predicted RNase H-like HicB family nuclease
MVGCVAETQWPQQCSTEDPFNLTIETEREVDGRWIAEVPELPGVLAYGMTENEAAAKAEALALRVLADRLDHGERSPGGQVLGRAEGLDPTYT